MPVQTISSPRLPIAGFTHAPGVETRPIQAGTIFDPSSGARTGSINQTLSDAYLDSNHGTILLGLWEPGTSDTRVMTPTQAALAQSIADLDGGLAAPAPCSGQSAEVQALLNRADHGAPIVASFWLDGGTIHRFRHPIPSLGPSVFFVEYPDGLGTSRSAIHPHTKAFFGESIGNPKGHVFDLEGGVQIGHGSTWLEHGADVSRVIDSGLVSSPGDARAQCIHPRGQGAMVSFELPGGQEAGRRFVEAMELDNQLAHGSDGRSLIIHPASTSPSQLSVRDLASSGVTQGLVRLAIGLECLPDLPADLETGPTPLTA